MIVDAPNESGAYASSRAGHFIKQRVRPYFSKLAAVSVGPPPATLSVAVMPPADYRLSVRTAEESSDHCSHFDMAGPRLTLPKQIVDPDGDGDILDDDGRLPPKVYRRYAAAVKAVPHFVPKATIILLHGYGLNKYSMLRWAFVLGEAGYRTVLVDLRGHGASTGQWTTYGIVESRDIAQVIDYLQAQNLIAGSLAVLGDSLGAAVAIDVAARDERVQAIVALHPFARADQIIENFGRIVHPFLTALLPESSIAADEEKAGQLAGVDLENAAPIRAVENVNVPILFIYGDKDRITPPATARAFKRAAPDGKLIMLKGYGHFSLSASPAVAMQPVLKWLAPHLGGTVPGLSAAEPDSDGEHTRRQSEDASRFGLEFSMCITH